MKRWLRWLLTRRERKIDRTFAALNEMGRRMNQGEVSRDTFAKAQREAYRMLFGQ